MLDYIIKVLLFQSLFLAVYDLFLKKETFFQLNRAYLIVSSILAYIIPLLKIDSVSEIIPTAYLESIVYLPEVMLSPTTVIEEKFDWALLLFTSLKWIFWIGLLLAALLFLNKLYQIIKLIYKNEKQNNESYQLVFLKDKRAFSFFNYIFLGKDIEQVYKKQIIEHELVHVRQKHSFDLLIFELQKIIFWFNPFSYLFQRRIAELHEFIADSKSIKETDKSNYFQNLLTQTFQVQKISFINPFLKASLINKRIVMLNKHKSKQVLKLKYLVLIPVFLSMLIYTSCEKDKSEKISKNQKRLITLYMGDGVKMDSREIKSEKEGYFDVYMLGAKPSSGKEISYFDLTSEEKEDFQRFRKAPSDVEGENLNFEYKIYEMADGSKALYEDIDWKGLKSRRAEKDYSNAVLVPFSHIDKTPVFPDCEDAEDQKKCLQESISKHVNKEFNLEMANGLGLDSGKKKVYVQFVINKNGNVENIRTRGPDVRLEDEAQRVIGSLPNMLPGEQDGKKVSVKYTLPITLNIE